MSVVAEPEIVRFPAISTHVVVDGKRCVLPDRVLVQSAVRFGPILRVVAVIAVGEAQTAVPRPGGRWERSSVRPLTEVVWKSVLVGILFNFCNAMNNLLQLFVRTLYECVI